MTAVMDRQTFLNLGMQPTANLRVRKTTTYQMKVNDTVVIVDTSAGAWTLTLPPVCECGGVEYVVKFDDGALGGAPTNLTITDKSDSVSWPGDIILSRPNQGVRLKSDGESWERILTYAGASVVSGAYVYETWKKPFVLGTVLGGAPSTTLENVMLTGAGNTFSYIGKVAQTLHPQWANPGVNWAGDQVDDDGWEFTTGIGTGNQLRFIVGQGGFFCRARFSIADVSGTDDCAFGFRKREAYQAAVDDYDEMAALNVISGDIFTETILNNAATVSTDTTNNWADTETHTLEVRVNNAGHVNFFIDDVPPIAAVAFNFDSGEVLIPFFYMLQTADLTGAVTFTEFECGPFDS